MDAPKKIFSGYHGSGHCQGIAVDMKKGYIYYSFTTKLVKSDLSGNVIGTVDGLIGHLGCIDFHERDGRVYGSLEFKNDEIGKGVLAEVGKAGHEFNTAFYCAIFDVDRIDRMGMDAEKDGVMRTVYLPNVVEDYEATVTVDGKVLEHKYGSGGMDGTGWGPAFGKKGGKEYLNICYGIRGDVTRDDNDYQVIVTYDAENWWDELAQPLCQDKMHRNGAYAMKKHFLYTGNTTWGVQNLEYDAHSGDWLLAVYVGTKPKFPNFHLYRIDGAKAPITTRHEVYGEEISLLSQKEIGECQNGIWGTRFPYGSTGIYAFGDGRFYFSVPGGDAEKGQYTNVLLYRANGAEFEKVD